MFYLLLSLFFNLVIFIAFKLFPKYKTDTNSIIVINYFIAATLSFVYAKDQIDMATISGAPWLPIAFSLGFIFYVTFLIISMTIQKIGLSIGSLFPKMSMIFSVLFAYFIYNENISLLRWVGICLAVVGIIFLLYPSRDRGLALEKSLRKHWALPLFALVGSGIIEILLFVVEKENGEGMGNAEFLVVLFITAGIVGTVISLIRKTLKLSTKEIAFGFTLGIINFYSIYFLMMALSANIDASIAFPFLNIGIIVLGLLMGIIAFNEKLSKQKILGVCLSVIAVVLILIA